MALISIEPVRAMNIRLLSTKFTTMKKKKLWLLSGLLFMGAVTVWGQPLQERFTTYSASLTDHSFGVVGLGDAGSAIIGISQVYDDAHTAAMLLSGKYRQINSEIIVYDSIHNITLHAVVFGDSTLHFTKTFPGLLQAHFILTDTDLDVEFYAANAPWWLPADSVRWRQQEYQSLHPRPYSLKTGTYRVMIIEPRARRYVVEYSYKLLLGPEGDYQVFYGDLLMSEGIWRQEGNLLVLHDQMFEQDYCLLIGKRKTLISMLLPGDYLNDSQHNKYEGAEELRYAGKR